MPQKGLSMRKIREILRYRYEFGHTVRAVARLLHLSHSTVLEYLRRARVCSITWPLPLEMDDETLERMLFPKRHFPVPHRTMPDITSLCTELSKKGVTLSLLWEEYKETHPDGYQYSQFCHWFHEKRKTLDRSFRQIHRFGEKLFTDFAGHIIPIQDATTGSTHPAHIFVAVLGASNYTYVEAFEREDLSSWITAHRHALEFFAGVPELIVPDNTRCAVKKASRYDPDLNPVFSDFADHYGCTVYPTRVRKPKDKAKVENGVLLVERWILARLRHYCFFHLAELNQKIIELRDRLNSRPFQKISGNRKERFLQFEQPTLRSLPPTPYEYLQMMVATVPPDYHVRVDGHYYSVPHSLVGKRVDIRVSPYIIEILAGGCRVASHERQFDEGGMSTIPDHRPFAHQAYASWTHQTLWEFAEKTGPATVSFLQTIALSRHPQELLRIGLGLKKLAAQYSPERLEKGCERAIRINSFSYSSLESILKRGLESLPLSPEECHPDSLILHDNIRGKYYYSLKGE